MSENGISIAVISAQAGAIVELLLDGVSVIPRFSLANPEDFIFGSVLAPWPNRLEDGKYRQAGIDYGFEALDAQNNKSHGLLLRENLEIRSHTESKLILGHLFGTDSGYPFQVDLEVKYELLEASLLVSAIATNLGPAAPFAIGFHPYLVTGDHCKISAAFTHAALTDDRMLPFAIEPIAGLELDQDSQQLRTLDACFHGASSVFVTGSSGSFEVKVLENLPYFMLYRPAKQFFEGGGAIAIEPMSAPANIFRTDPESVQLASGESKRFRFEIKTL